MKENTRGFPAFPITPPYAPKIKQIRKEAGSSTKENTVGGLRLITSAGKDAVFIVTDVPCMLRYEALLMKCAG